MEPVKQPMNKWSQDYCRHRQKSDPAVESVKCRKKLCRRRIHVIDRPHAGENHRSIQQSIDPGQICEVTVTDATYHQRQRDDQYGYRKAASKAKRKKSARQQRLVILFKQWSSPFRQAEFCGCFTP